MTARADLPATPLLPESQQFLATMGAAQYSTADVLGAEGVDALRTTLNASGTRLSTINNRRYLGNKHGITGFIREVVEAHCPDVETVADVFTGTGAVANAFADKTLFTNDLLYSNYLSSIAWFSPAQYRPEVIIEFVAFFNGIETSEDNYVRKNFADTYFSADDCSVIGEAREIVSQARERSIINDRENAILVTSILYGIDRIANTVGHYDAYRKNAAFDRILQFPAILPDWKFFADNRIYNDDANKIIGDLDCDLLYLDPPYNSRQYSDAYHLLENIARWEFPEVHGVARKMDRTPLKSDYNTVRAADALRDLVSKTSARYIVLSYNNMASKGNGRSNAKISDEDIMEILQGKGTVTIHETDHKAFSTGKSSISDNSERLFVCAVEQKDPGPRPIVLSPINYIGGKGRLISQLQPLLQPAGSGPLDCFVDVFAGGCTVGANITAEKVIFNDKSTPLVNLMRFLAESDTEDLIRNVDERIAAYGLSDTHRLGYSAFRSESSSGLAKYNKPGYLKLRDDYNKLNPDDPGRDLLLYLLIIFGFNNQLRFNRNDQFNLPVGKRDFNAKMRKKLELFHERLQSIDYEFTTRDFRDIDIDSLPKKTLFYCDPPYLITEATYNERGGWSEVDEHDLLKFLDAVNDSGRSFALSNVTHAKGRSNDILTQWLDHRDLTTHTPSMSYSNSNYQRANSNSLTVEVLITNL